jgi:hypothetical protein
MQSSHHDTEISMKRHCTTALVLLGVIATTGAQAATVPFSATWVGTSQIVEVIDPGPPVVRFQTDTTGSGSFGLVAYASQDIVNMATGAGSGTNVFTAGNGDQLFGSFKVQIIPTAAPGVVDLVGQTTFTGGTGYFLGASGMADFTGTGVFTSATAANASFNYSGQIAVVPEPGAWALMTLGLAALGALRRMRSGPQGRWAGSCKA